MTKIAIVPGRFSPAHYGHISMIKQAKTESDLVFIPIIMGKKTAKDVERNPLGYGLRKKIITRQVPGVKVFRISSADIPEMMKYILTHLILDDPKIHFIIYTGPDRPKEYRRQIQKKYLDEVMENTGKKITAKVKSLEREASSSSVRHAMRKGADTTAMFLLGTLDKSFYKQIKSAVMKNDKHRNH